MARPLVLRMFRHPALAANEVLEQRSELSSIVINAAHGFLLMLWVIVAVGGRNGVYLPFALVFALLYGPPLAFLLAWGLSLTTWGCGRLFADRSVERQKVVLFQAWTSAPLLFGWLLLVVVSLMLGLLPEPLPESLKWAGMALVGLSATSLVYVSLRSYGEALKVIYGLTRWKLASLFVVSLLVHAGILLALFVAFTSTLDSLL